MLEAKPQAPEAQRRDYQSTVAVKPRAYRTVLRPGRNWGTEPGAVAMGSANQVDSMIRSLSLPVL